MNSAKTVKSLWTIDDGAMLILGNLKVGKSTLFSRLVKNRFHPITKNGDEVMLQVSTGAVADGKHLIDIPGIYSLYDRSEDAAVIRLLFFMQKIGSILLVLDAKNLRRGLALLLQIAPLKLPVVVALNMVDEATQRGIQLNFDQLKRVLQVPVIPLVATEGHGIGQLRRSLGQAKPMNLVLDMPEPLLELVSSLQIELDRQDQAFAPGMATFISANLPDVMEYFRRRVSSPVLERVESILQKSRSKITLHSDFALINAALSHAQRLAEDLMEVQLPPKPSFFDKLGVWTRHAWTGIPIAFVVIGLCYLIIGWFGAKVLVNFLEGQLYGQILQPWFAQLLTDWGCSAWVKEFLIGHYGLISVGIMLPVAVILPVLVLFFFLFSFLEDSGYLSRVSLLMDRLLRRIGLNGRGLVPLIMGFSCVTMAVLATRVLDSPKQRTIATLLLVLAFPCAPLLGVMMVMLSNLSAWATVIVFGSLVVQFLLVGFLANLFLPAGNQDFIMELPPLRVPKMADSLRKTYQRVVWFLKDAIPFFLVGTFVLFLLDLTGAIDFMFAITRPFLEKVLGLPGESADVFLMSFVRREAGAALLVHHAQMGRYDGIQVVVAMLVMTLMIPCFNSLLVTYKEQGFVNASLIMVFVMVYALAFGSLANLLLRASGVAF